MEKQKSYGKNYQKITAKHKFSLKFWVITIGCCVFAVVLASVLGVVL